jgi:hypothetical protein
VTTRKSSTRLVLIAIAVAISACGFQPTADSRLDDEAMARAKRAGLNAEDVAYRYYYPDYIDNYFAGMDAIAVLRPAGTAPDAPIDQFDTPVYQLMDKKAPGRVEKLDPIRLHSVAIDKSKKQLCHQTEQPEACEVLGRNTWMMWAGGNEGFWDWLGRQYGFLDFVRLLDTREAGDPNGSKRNDRESRFARGGLINEPGMGPSLDEEGNVIERILGLRIDEPLDKDVREWRRRYVAKALGLDGAGAAAAKADQGYSYGGSYNNGASSSYAGLLKGDAVEYPNKKSYDPRIPPPEIYGLSSGVVGLRLFPNPNFDKKALERWLKIKDTYASNPVGGPTIIRPFRVGMSCAFCHASFHPLNPPADVVNPKWENISGNIGAQYLRMSATLGNLLPKNNFVYHILDSQPPGTVDTSLVASDNINNPNTMNSVFNLAQRVLVSLQNPKERLSDPSARLPSVWGKAENGYPDAPPPALTKLIGEYWKAVYAKEGEPSQAEQAELDKAVAEERSKMNDQTRRVPRILLDGSDSIGAWGALARVYLNIGSNWEQWNTLHDPIVGLTPQKPFTIDNVERHSAYWAATKLRVGPLRDYFLRVTPSMPLLAAALPVDSASPDSIPDLAKQRGLVDYTKLKQGREVFARNCIACHSSIQPPSRHEQMAKDAGQTGSNVGNEFFDHDPGQWMRDPRHKEYQDWALRAVELPEFWRANYLSTDYRVPVNYVKTNSCRAMATNALTGNMWQDFASDSDRNLPSIGDISFFNPYGEKTPDDNAVFSPRHNAKGAPRGGGGPGFYRVPTLVSIWATAPYLHNNSLGKFTGNPSIRGRLEGFDDGIEKLLWKEKRTETVSYGVKPEQLKADHGLIWRTLEPTYLSISGIYLPEILGGHSPVVRDFLARYPELRTIPQAYRPVPTAALLLLAFLLLWLARSHWLRRLGYLSIVLALVVGGVIYFLHGGLGGVTIGPIPKGTPVGLLSNINPDADRKVLKQSLATVRDAFTEIESTRANPERQEEIMKTKVAPALIAVSKCPDLVMDRGHYFPWFADMSDSDKKALIELLKTF